MVAVKELLSETLSDLSSEESKNLKWFVQFTSFQRSLPDIHLGLVPMADGTDALVDMMVKKCGLKSVDIMREIFMDMNRTDLVQRLSETNSTPKGKIKRTTVTLIFNNEYVWLQNLHLFFVLLMA